MTEKHSTRRGVTADLRFACSCVSAADITEDPWTDVSKQKRFDDGTKELILNAIHRRPRTIAQLAEELELSRPAVHRHISELFACELIREVDVLESQRRSAVERYYAPNFPVVLASDRGELQPFLEEMAGEVAEVFRRRRDTLTAAYSQTHLPERAGDFETLAHWFYATATRMAREKLEEQGDLPQWPRHADGSRWLWWAEEPLDDGDLRTQ